MSMFPVSHGTHRQRQALSLLCLVNMLLMTTGMPFYQTNAKDRRQEFICMDSQCGCMTAEQCWRYCCCHTLEEKLAWAKEHHISPPAYVLEQIAAKQNDACCCQENTRQDNNAARGDDKTSCCADENGEPGGFTWLATWQSLKCQGQNGWSLLFSILVIDPTRDEGEPCTPPFREYVITTELFSSSPTMLLDAPPPRL